MKKRRILSLVLTIGVVLGVSNFAYASEKVADSTKVAVESNVAEGEKVKDYITDEEATEIAARAMKEHLNIDVNLFAETEVQRHSPQFEDAPNTIWIHYYKADLEYRDNSVALDAETGEVIRVSREGRRDIFKGEVRKDKIKESIINALAKEGLKPDNDTNWDSIFVCHDGGDANMYLHVNGGKSVEMCIDLDDFSLISLYKMYRTYPNIDFVN